jgi:spermidine/putrescine transport system substrate-binding protein
MNRRSLILALPLAGGCRLDRRPRLNVFNWSTYSTPETVPGFECETGARVRYAVFESNEEMLARVLSGNSGWDVVFPSNSLIHPMRELGLLARLRRPMLENLKHLDAAFREPSWDPRLEWAAPFMWGATGIAYNRSVSPAPESWSAMWDPRLRGRITMLDDPADVIGACLKKLGFSLNSQDPAELAAAHREAMAQKPLLRAYINAEVRDQLVAGDVLAAQMWATVAQQAMDASPQIRFVYPRDGFLLYADCAVVLRESRHQELAHRFIEYLLRPAVSASIARYNRTATASAAARALLPEADRANRALYPDAPTMSRGEWTGSFPPSTQRLRDRLWTEIKSA